MNDKFSDFERSDFIAVAELHNIPDANEIIDNVMGAISMWHKFSAQAKLPEEEMIRVKSHFRPVTSKKVRYGR